jgi:hypothetical protein
MEVDHKIILKIILAVIHIVNPNMTAKQWFRKYLEHDDSRGGISNAIRADGIFQNKTLARYAFGFLVNPNYCIYGSMALQTTNKTKL